MKYIAVLIIMVLLGTKSQAIPVIEWNTVSFNSNYGGFSFFTEFPYSGRDGASIWGVLTLDPGGSWADLDAESGTIGVAHKWFIMDYDNLIDSRATETAEPFATIYFSNIEFHSAILNVNQPFYLGFQIGSTEFTPYQVQYGWVELLFDGDSLNYVSSATERTGLGIYAGTGTAVPEPSTIGLLSIGALGMAWKRRTRKSYQDRRS